MPGMSAPLNLNFLATVRLQYDQTINDDARMAKENTIAGMPRCAHRVLTSYVYFMVTDVRKDVIFVSN